MTASDASLDRADILARRLDYEYASTAFGLLFLSDLELFELRCSTQSSSYTTPPENKFYGAVGIRWVESSYLEQSTSWFGINEEGSAIIALRNRFSIQISKGSKIDIRGFADTDQALIRLYLLGSAMGCILHQRGLIPLHISTVYINGQAWGFTAPSGTGKSTLAARLHHFAGCPMVSDDVAALYLIDGEPYVAGGPPLMKLQPDFASLFKDAIISPIPHPESNKLKVQPKNAFIQGLVPLAGIIVLERDDTVAHGDLAIEALTGANAFMGAREAIYRYQMGLAMSSQAHMFNKLTELTTHVPFYRGKLGQWRIEDGGTTETSIVEHLATLKK